jgi:hypothetical protein
MLHPETSIAMFAPLSYRACACRNPSISTTLVGMCSSDVVRANVTAVLQALGAEAVDSSSARQEKKALEEVERILAPVKDLAWASGKPENQ